MREQLSQILCFARKADKQQKRFDIACGHLTILTLHADVLLRDWHFLNVIWLLFIIFCVIFVLRSDSY